MKSKGLIIIIMFLLTFNAFSAQSDKTKETSTEKKKSVSNEEKKLKKNSNDVKKALSQKLKKTSKRFRNSSKMGINEKLRNLVLKIRRNLRLAVMAYRKSNYSLAIRLNKKARTQLDELESLYKEKIKIRNQFAKKLQIIQKIHSLMHRKNLSGAASNKVYQARQLIIYSQRLANKQNFKKAHEYLDRAKKLLKKAETDNRFQNNKNEKRKQQARIANKLESKVRSLLWKRRDILIPGPIRRDYFKARGHYLRGVHFSNNGKFGKSIDELQKADKILLKLPDRVKEQRKLKNKASLEIQKANGKLVLVRNKRLVDESLANFIKAKKLLQRAKTFFKQSRFERAKSNALKAYDILKQL